MKQQPFTGLCFNVVSVKLFSDPKDLLASRQLLIKQANSFSRDTIITEPDGRLTFLDPHFSLQRKHLTRSAYLGHLHEGRDKGCKVYSIKRPCPTFTSYGNVLIWDDRVSPGQVRKLSFNEMLRLNSFPLQTVHMLQENKDKALRYIANAIPTNMLHTIYKTVIADFGQRTGFRGRP